MEPVASDSHASRIPNGSSVSQVRDRSGLALPAPTLPSLNSTTRADAIHYDKELNEKRQHILSWRISRLRHQRNTVGSTLPQSVHAFLHRLRLDRNRWRATALENETRLSAATAQAIEQEERIMTLQSEVDIFYLLHDQQSASQAASNSRVAEVTSERDAVAQQLVKTERKFIKLKTFTRSKQGVLQHNLRLKAFLKCISMKHKEGSVEANKDRESELIQALALAKERIEELEQKGGALLDALEQINDETDTEEEETGEENCGEASLLEAEVAFRSVLEDETFGEQWKSSECLLHE